MRIAIDFDETLVQRSAIWPTPGVLMPGAKEALCHLTNSGHQVIIWSSRISGRKADEQHAIVEEYLYRNGIPFFEIDNGRNGKIGADVYIDDRAIRFCPKSSDWNSVIAQVREIEKKKNPAF